MSRLITLLLALCEKHSDGANKMPVWVNLNWFSTVLLSVKRIEQPSNKQTAHVMEEYGHKKEECRNWPQLGDFFALLNHG